MDNDVKRTVQLSDLVDSWVDEGVDIRDILKLLVAMTTTICVEPGFDSVAIDSRTLLEDSEVAQEKIGEIAFDLYQSTQDRMKRLN